MNRPPKSPRGKPPPRLYLWLCCEGWIRHGPFAWISLRDEDRVYINEWGEPIAWWDPAGACWRSTIPGKEGRQCRTPVITSSFRHPRPKTGGIPIKERS